MGQVEASKKYNDKTYEEIKIRVKKGDKKIIKEFAEKLGMSTNGYIINSIKKELLNLVNREKEYNMNEFKTLKSKIEELNIKIAEKNCGGSLSRLINEINAPHQNGIVIGDDYLDEIRKEFFNSDFDSTNEEIENKLEIIGKDKEYKEYLENVIRDLKLEIEE